MALGISEAVELAKKVAELAKKGMTLELQERITELREAVINAKDEVINLRDENQGLRTKLREQESWDTRASKYELVQADGGGTIYKSAGPPEHFACTACFENRSLHVLQERDGWSGLFVCPGCKHIYRVKPPRPSEPRSVVGRNPFTRRI